MGPSLAWFTKAMTYRDPCLACWPVHGSRRRLDRHPAMRRPVAHQHPTDCQTNANQVRPKSSRPEPANKPPPPSQSTAAPSAETTSKKLHNEVHFRPSFISLTGLYPPSHLVRPNGSCKRCGWKDAPSRNSYGDTYPGGHGSRGYE
jgi:hypothetical protein